MTIRKTQRAEQKHLEYGGQEGWEIGSDESLKERKEALTQGPWTSDAGSDKQPS